MNTNLSDVFHILQELDNAPKERIRRVYELLSPDPPSTIRHILIGQDSELCNQPFRNLLEDVSQIVLKHKVQRYKTDWPFEHFWDNPYEPRHSKLLKYFINPDNDPSEKHGSEAFLLGQLVEVLKQTRCLPSDRHYPIDYCKVSQPDYIDLLIERDCKDDNKDDNYAIIIENKINWAPDQRKQLQRYVTSVIKRKYDRNQIFVFYLPLTSAKSPNADDVAAVKRMLPEKHYRLITFEEHIMNWLESALKHWPPAMWDEMRENLSHYRNLIRYLINQQKELNMNKEILDRLKQTKNKLPTLSQVTDLQKSAEDLKECLEMVLYGQLLLKIQQQILQKDKHADTWFCLGDEGDEPLKKIKVATPYDERFSKMHLCVGTSTDVTVSVCLGNGEEKFWLGYMENGSSVIQKRYGKLIDLEARNHIKKLDDSYGPWYAWGYSEVTHNYNDIEEYSRKFADKLLEMRNSLVARLKA